MRDRDWYSHWIIRCACICEIQPSSIYEVHSHDSKKTLGFSFEKQELNFGNGILLGRNMVSPVSWRIWKQVGRKLYANRRMAARPQADILPAPATSKTSFRFGHDKVLALFI